MAKATEPEPYSHSAAKIRISKRRLLLVVVLLVIAVVAVYAAVRFMADDDTAGRTEESGILASIEPTAVYYDGMTAEQVDAQLQRQIGVTYDQLVETPVSDLSINSFDDAYFAGMALYQLDDSDKTRELFKIAEKKADTSSSYRFYIAYATLLQQYPNTTDQSLKLYNEAKRRINADKDLSTAEKTKIVEKVTMAIRDMEIQ